LNEREKLIELSNETGFKIKFQAEGMVIFWASSPVKREYSELYEKGFSSLTQIKTKYRNRLDVRDNLRLKLISIHPNIELCKNQQAQKSH
jgi:hypothetical protein